MLFLIVSDKQVSRRTYIKNITGPFSGSEILIGDDTHMCLADIEQYVYPSLFNTTVPIVHLKFMLLNEIESLTNEFLKKLLASPTIFIFEEMTLPFSVITPFKKIGAVVYADDKTSIVKKESDIFLVTQAITAPDKKSRWIAYRSALLEHSIEAIVGILYWKVRDLVIKNPKNKERYLALYKNLLTAHAQSWKEGTPLELMIEKVILTQ